MVYKTKKQIFKIKTQIINLLFNHIHKIINNNLNNYIKINFY